MNKKQSFKVFMLNTLAITLFFMLFIAPNISHATTDTIGGTTNNDQGFSSGYVVARLITASASGTLQSVGINMYSCTGNIQVAIYADSGGNPAALLGYSGTTACSNGWNDLSITSGSVSIVSGTSYFIAYDTDQTDTPYNNGMFYIWYIAQMFGTMPNPFGSGTMSNGANFGYNMRMTYTNPSCSTNCDTLIANPNPPLVSNTPIQAGNSNRYSTVNSIISNGIIPYTGNWVWTAPNTLTSSSVSNTIISNILYGGLPNSFLIANAVSSTQLILVFNSVVYSLNAFGTNTIYGVWTFGLNANDINGNYVSSTTNTFTIMASTSTSTTTTTTTSTTTSSTTTSIIPTTTINGHGLNVSSVGAAFADTFNIPFAGIGLMILIFGISVMLSKRLSIAFLMAALMSYLILYLGQGQPVGGVTLAVSATVTILWIFLGVYEIFGRHRRH